MQTRTKSAEITRQKILSAVVNLWSSYAINEISLEMVAEHSGLTMRTILRKFGSREGMLTASIAHASEKILHARDLAPAGNLTKALEVLLSEYEATGDAVIRTIMLQDSLPFAKSIIQGGIQIHRDWCKRVFAPYLPSLESDSYEMELSAFVCATEIYLWKLLRRDLNKSYKQTFSIFHHTLQCLIEASHNRISK